MQRVQSTHIFMLHVFEQSELSVGPLSKDLWLEGPVELFNGHFLFSLLVYCWAVGNDNAVSLQLFAVGWAFHSQYNVHSFENDWIVYFEVSFSEALHEIQGNSKDDLKQRYRTWDSFPVCGGLWLTEHQYVNVWQLLMCMFARICGAPNRRRTGLLGYLEPHPPTHITHFAVCCGQHCFTCNS